MLSLQLECRDFKESVLQAMPHRWVSATNYKCCPSERLSTPLPCHLMIPFTMQRLPQHTMVWSLIVYDQGHHGLGSCC